MSIIHNVLLEQFNCPIVTNHSPVGLIMFGGDSSLRGQFTFQMM
jgi:hypothetical protein